MSIKMLFHFLVLASWAASTAARCLWGCERQRETAGVLDGTGVTINNLHNATVLVGVLKDLQDHHSTRFTNLEIGVGALLVIAGLVVFLWIGRRLWSCGIRKREEYVSSRMRSIIRRYNRDAPDTAPSQPTTKV